MTNLEYMVKYYPDMLIDLATNGEKLAIDISSDDGDKVCDCAELNCSDCKFDRSDKSCEDLAADWLRAKYDGIIVNSDDTSNDDEGGISW